MTTSISSNKQAKIEAAKQLADKAFRAQSVVLADYQGLSHQQLEKLRKKIRTLDAEFTITKNSLIARALAQTNQIQTTVDGPTATLFSYADAVGALKALVTFFTDNDAGQIKLGVIEGQLLTAEQTTQLSKLPGKDQLRGQVVGLLARPMTGFTNALAWNMQKLVWTIAAIQKQKT